MYITKKSRCNLNLVIFCYDLNCIGLTVLCLKINEVSSNIKLLYVCDGHGTSVLSGTRKGKTQNTVKNQYFYFHYHYNINYLIGKRQVHNFLCNHVFLNELSKGTAFMFAFAPLSFIKLTASKNFPLIKFTS